MSLCIECIMKNKQWSRDVVVEEIKHVFNSGGDLRHSFVSSKNPRLVSAAIRYFGSWGDAVNASGIDYSEICRLSQESRSAKVTKWSSELITDEIKKIALAGESLAATTVRGKYPSLFSAAVSPKYFNSWRNAVTSAGFDYDEILAKYSSGKSLPSSSRGMKTLIRRLRIIGSDIQNVPSDVARTRYKRLYERAEVHFGSWEKAVKAALQADQF